MDFAACAATNRRTTYVTPSRADQDWGTQERHDLTL
jgi:hypothetical protein